LFELPKKIIVTKQLRTRGRSCETKAEYLSHSHADSRTQLHDEGGIKLRLNCNSLRDCTIKANLSSSRT